MNPDTNRTRFERARSLTIELVRHTSVTATAGEASFADRLHAILADIPYFREHPDDLWLQETDGGPDGRRNVWALVRGRGRRTVLLTGHYDVVTTGDYGDLEDVATDPEALLPRLRAALEGAGGDTERLARDDLAGDEFLPGRGALDMKSGLAAGLVTLERFAEDPERTGNLLFVAVADEEATSAGMRALSASLPHASQEHALEVVAAINLDAISDRGNGSAGRAACLGSSGKLLPFVYVKGVEAHSAYPFDGIGANALAADVVRRLDGNAELCDEGQGEGKGEVAPPPVNLSARDDKTSYDVTSPGAAWLTFNVLMLSRGPREVLEMVRGEVRAALEEALARHASNAVAFASRSGRTTPELPAPAVVTYAELLDAVTRERGESFRSSFDAFLADLANDPAVDLPEFSRRATERLWRASGRSGPAAVIGFGALYYPRVGIDRARPAHARLHAAVERGAASIERDTGESVALRPFFPAISDMSFLGGTDTDDDLDVMTGNTPATGTRITFDFRAARELDVPTVNIGPWGRDYHQRTERVYAPYAFGVLPELVWRVAMDVLEG